MTNQDTMNNSAIDTSRMSYYVDPEFYRRLQDTVDIWQEDWSDAPNGLSTEVERLLFCEARTIDDGRFNDWLDLFAAECLYWVPSTPGGDPRFEVAHAFDDRRRLTDRVYWLRTGLAFCQIPQSRTRRLITNIECCERGDRIFVRANVLTAEFRAGRSRTYAGWCAYELVRAEGQALQIAIKQVNLIDSENGHENLTLVL